MSNVDIDNMVNANGNVKTVFSDINDEDEENSKMISKEKVVPVDHVEEVINRVIVDLGHALYNLKEARYEVPDTPIQEKCITHRDLERALQMMKLQLVTEIRQVQKHFHSSCHTNVITEGQITLTFLLLTE